ncbi:MAG: adenosylmethionine--8-amino-7-oxononanoate transaminase [Verrucomicrobiaceae bacterium]|nr:adenosylmethionine--8-amino-7-oxononanoate transaminase [Verrucomicrobiaceae bacterium]
MADWQHLIALEKQHLWHPFTPMQDWCAPEHEPLMLVSGQGCVLRDQHGREYLDGNSSIWTNIHGHNHPTITAAITKQLRTVAHTSFLGFTHPPAIELAKQLVDLFPGEKLMRVFYSDNGSTAIEAGVRMALQYWKQNGAPQRDTVLSFDRAYHGDTLGAASLGGLPVFKGSGNDFGYNVVRVASMEALEQVDASRLAVVIIEPSIQGAAGMRVWPQGMLRQLKTWCHANDVLLMLDEVMTGFGRTGKMFACLHEDVVPDIIAMAKGITGGYLPLAATLTTERLFAGFLAPGNTFYYGHSYTANQAGCAAALASLQVFKDEHVLELLPQKVEQFSRALDVFRVHPAIKEVRQVGLIAGIEVCSAELVGPRICMAAREHGLLTRPVLNTLVLMPPLCATEDEMQRMVNALRLALDSVL